MVMQLLHLVRKADPVCLPSSVHSLLVSCLLLLACPYLMMRLTCTCLMLLACTCLILVACTCQILLVWTFLMLLVWTVCLELNPPGRNMAAATEEEGGL